MDTGEDDAAAVTGQGKIGFIRFGGGTGAANQRASTCFNGQLRNLPLGAVVRIVRKESAAQLYSLIAGVQQLNPVALGSVIVDDCKAAARHHFADDHAGGLGTHFLQPCVETSIGVGKTGGGIDCGAPVAAFVTNQGDVCLHRGYLTLVNQHIRVVIKQDGILTLAGDAKSAITVGVTFLVAPAYHIGACRQNGAVGEGVADEIGTVGNHVAGNIHGGIRIVADFYIVQILTAGGNIGAVSRQNFT